jgi:hypothetical protein
MAKEPKRLDFKEFALNPGKVFDDMASQRDPVLIDVKGRVYRLELEAMRHDIWQGYNPKKVRQRLRDCAGVLAGIDHEALLRDIHSARKQASRGRSD